MCDVMDHARRNVEYFNPTLPTSIVGLPQVYTDKAATKVMVSTMGPYPIHIIILLLTPFSCRRLIKGGMFLIYLHVTNRDGEDGTPDAPDDQSVVMSDRRIKGNSSPNLITLHEYLTSITASYGRVSRIGVLHNYLRESFLPLIDHGENAS